MLRSIIPCFRYDALSRRTSLTRPNGVNTAYSYNNVSNLLSVLHQLGTTTLDGASYTGACPERSRGDLAGNRKTRTDKRLGTTLTYAYDNIYQLLTAKQGTTTKESYTGACPERYSSREAMRVSRRNPVGNRLSSVGVTPYQYNTSNQLTSIPGTTYTYDNNGNTKTKTTAAGTTTYTWDFENRLTQVALPGTTGTVTFKYDPFGRRVQKAFTQGGTTNTTNYLYDGRNLLEEVDTSGNVVARYTDSAHDAGSWQLDQPLAELRSGTTIYYQQDGLGSVTSLSNSTGTFVNTYTYDSYGKLSASTGAAVNPFQYTARDFDAEIGIYQYRFRYYDQNVGRFLSEDPLGFGGGPNFYAYVTNDPVDIVDPFGLKGRRRPPIPPPPVPNPLPNAIGRAYDAFSDCANNITVKCSLPAAPTGNPFNPPRGPKGDMGVTPNEGTLPIPQFSDPLAHNCDCLKQHPMAALDSRFQFEPGNQNYGISPGCMISIP
jgi:RHS repeat-associated protein